MGNRIVLITGGARSGKSAYALKIGQDFSKKAYVATGQALDDEMIERIEKHRRERDGSFRTFEAPLELTQTLRDISAGFDFVVVDCLTLWISNLLFKVQNPSALEKAIEDFLSFLPSRPFTLALVSNEVGMGVVPGNQLGRKFRDLQGKLNQRAAEIADEVILMISGLPVFIKKSETCYAAS